MAVYYNIDTLPAFRKAVITIGTFDGVHLGHKTILQEVVKHAREVNGESVLITFEPHPRKVLFPGTSLKLLTPLDEKIELLTAEGIEHIVVAPFTKEFSRLSAGDYISDFLVGYFNPDSIVIGYDHHFGHDRSGNIQLLQQLATQYNYKVYEIPAQLIDEAAVSSTKIRNALTNGDVKDAAHMLGRHFSISGTVITGAQLGRTIGYPTANIQPIDEDQLIPAIGIYAVLVLWQGREYKAMLSIGNNPTVSDTKELHIEANIFDFNADIYGETLKVSFVEKLRDEVKFDSIELLTQQLHKDKEATLKIFGST